MTDKTPVENTDLTNQPCSSNTTKKKKNPNEPRGQIVTINDAGLQAYWTQPREGYVSHTAAIVAIHDIFGYNMPTAQRFLDHLCSRTHMQAIMPDFFHGEQWPVSDYPPKDNDAFQQWIGGHSSWDSIAEHIKDAHKFLIANGFYEVGPLGFLGMGWGAPQAMRACCIRSHGERLECTTAGAVLIHGTGFDLNDAEQVKTPLLFLTGCDDTETMKVREALDHSNFGGLSCYCQFAEDGYGFVSGLGNWSVSHTELAVSKCLKLAADFFIRWLPSP